MKDFNNTWIKIYRGMLDWEWFSISEMVHLFIYLLLKANIEDKNWRGIEVKRGQLITSVATINNETHLSEQTIRTCLKRLISTNEITSKTTNKYTLITICNYESYQEKKEEINKQTNEQSNNQVTNEQQTSNKQLTTTKEYKNKRIKENKESSIAAKESAAAATLVDCFQKITNISTSQNETNWSIAEQILSYVNHEQAEMVFRYMVDAKKILPKTSFRGVSKLILEHGITTEAIEWFAVREQEKENNQKKLAQARVQKQEEEQREVERQARFVRAIEIGEVLAKEIEGYEKVPFPKRKAIQLEIAEQMPHEKNSEKIIKMYYSLINLNKAE